MQTVQHAQAQLLNAVRKCAKASCAAHARKQLLIVQDSDTGVLVSGSLATEQQVITAAVQQLNITVDPNELAQLAAATGCEDTQLNFTYNTHSMYIVSCYTQ